MESKEDKELYQKFLDGDNQALETIIKKYEKNLKYFILKYVKEMDAAEDILQSVIVYILEHKEKYDSKYSLKTYLYTIAKSRALNYLKKRQEDPLEIEENTILYQEERLLEDIILSKQRKEKIANVMRKMSPEYQQVIYLTIIEGLSYEETAKIMEKSISQIKNLLHRARKKMKKLLVEEKVVEMKNNKIIKLLLWIIVVVFISSGVVYAGIKIYKNLKGEASLNPNFTGKIGNTDYNSIWVGTFNLAWNELIEQYVGGNIEFKNGNTELVDELNKQSFRKDQLSEEDYYIKTGKTSPELKEQILKDIKGKFNIQDSLLDYFSFKSTSEKDFTIYAMLYKEFYFINTFDKLESGNFGQTEERVKYFGISKDSKETMNSNVEVLFYNNEKDFAVKLETRESEEIILYRTDENKSFNDYYEEIKIKANNYTGRLSLGADDELKIPYINIDTTINYNELCGKEIKGTNGMFLVTAAQNVKFMLNEYGGKLSSEALVMGSYNSYTKDLPQLNFFFDDTFVLFMKESRKEQPYMALKVDNTDILEIDNSEE